MKIIDTETMQKMIASFDAGLGIRATARACELDRGTVGKYYRQHGKTLCPCGKPMTHKGWCASRVARSPGRQKYIARFVTLKPEIKNTWLSRANLQAARIRFNEVRARLNAAWDKQTTMRDNDMLGVEYLIDAARDAARKRCVPQIIDDVVQDILVELLSGTLEAAHLGTSPAIGRIINRNYKLLLPASNVSLDDSPFADRSGSYVTNLPEDAPLWDEAIVSGHSGKKARKP